MDKQHIVMELNKSKNAPHFLWVLKNISAVAKPTISLQNIIWPWIENCHWYINTVVMNCHFMERWALWRLPGWQCFWSDTHLFTFLVAFFVFQSEVWICMEQMATCLDKLIKKLKEPVPEQIIGKMVVAVSLHHNSSIVFKVETLYNKILGTGTFCLFSITATADVSFPCWNKMKWVFNKQYKTTDKLGPEKIVCYIRDFVINIRSHDIEFPLYIAHIMTGSYECANLEIQHTATANNTVNPFVDLFENQFLLKGPSTLWMEINR